MFKVLHLKVTLATASILLIANTAHGQPITVSSQYPVVSNSDTDEPVCYMETVDGTTLNLSRLCEIKPKAQPEVVISNVGYEDEFLMGRVVNKSSKTVYQTRVNIEVIDDNGSVLGRGAISTEPPNLSPGQTATFQTLRPPGGKNVRTTSVEWDE